jgi:hypothetical protein
VDVNAGGAANFTNVTATVAVTVPDREECGPCLPDLAEWTCNNTPVDCADYASGHPAFEDCGFLPTGTALVYLNTHRFSFTEDGLSQGDELVATETINKSSRERVYINSTLASDSGDIYFPYFIRGEALFCSSYCPGVCTEVMADAYGYSVPIPNMAEIFSQACNSPRKSLGNAVVRIDYTCTWSQQVWMDYNSSDPILVGEFSGDVTLSVEMTFTWAPNDCSSYDGDITSVNLVSTGGNLP